MLENPWSPCVDQNPILCQRTPVGGAGVSGAVAAKRVRRMVARPSVYECATALRIPPNGAPQSAGAPHGKHFRVVSRSAQVCV